MLYRMSPDWRKMRQLDGRNFLADTAQANASWLQDYIPPDDQAHVPVAVHEAIRTKSLFTMAHRVRLLDGSLGWTFSQAVPCWTRLACRSTSASSRSTRRLNNKPE